eukprot:909075-Amorphochlora_amoeboformis.AAC.1
MTRETTLTPILDVQDVDHQKAGKSPQDASGEPVRRSRRDLIHRFRNAPPTERAKRQSNRELVTVQTSAMTEAKAPKPHTTRRRQSKIVQASVNKNRYDKSRYSILNNTLQSDDKVGDTECKDVWEAKLKSLNESDVGPLLRAIRKNLQDHVEEGKALKSVDKSTSSTLSSTSREGLAKLREGIANLREKLKSEGLGDIQGYSPDDISPAPEPQESTTAAAHYPDSITEELPPALCHRQVEAPTNETSGEASCEGTPLGSRK